MDIGTSERFFVDGEYLSAEACVALFRRCHLSIREKCVLALVEGNSIVDIGCYAGLFVDAVLRKCPEKNVIGVDYTDEHIRIAKLLFPNRQDRFRQMSVYDLEFERGSVDCITFQEVIEHLEGAASAIKEINRALRMGGVLIVTTPNPYYWRHVVTFCLYELRNQLRRLFGRPVTLFSQIYFDNVEWNRHIYSWTPDTLLTLLKVNGFDYVFHTYEKPCGALDRMVLAAFPFLGATQILKVRKVSEASKKVI